MQQSEVIQQALREAPPSPASSDFGELEAGEKLIRAHDLGDVDVEIVGEWVTNHGGRTVTLDGDLHWVVSEAAVAL